MSRSILAIALVAASAMALAAQPGSGLDLWDDPLPPGALARMGTLRLRSSHRANCLAISPDSKTLLSGNYDNKVQSWDVASGRLVAEWTVGSSALYGLQYSHDGKTVVAACGDGAVRLLDSTTGQVRRQFLDTPRRYGQIVAALSPDGRALVTTQRTDRQLIIWDVSTEKVKHRMKGISASPGYIPTVAFMPDSKQFVTLWSDNRIHLVNVATGKSVRPLEREGGKANPVVPGRGKASRRLAMALSPDGKTLVYRVSNDRAFHVLDVNSGKEIKRIERADRSSLSMGGMAISPNGRFLFESANDGVIRVWGLASGKVIRELTPPMGAVQHLCLSRDGKLVAASSGQVLHVWDVAAGTPLHTAAGHQISVTRLGFSPDGKRLLSFDTGSIHVWETATGREVQSARTAGGHGQSPLSVSPDGAMVSWLGYDRARYSLRVGVDREPVRLSTPRHTNNYSTQEVSPEGRVLACISEDHRLRLVHLVEDKSDRELAILADNHSYYLAFSPDGRLLAVAPRDGSMTLYGVETGLELRRLPPDASAAVHHYHPHVVFSRDSRLLLHWHGELKLLEVLTGGERVRFPREPGFPSALLLSDDGRLVARGQQDGAVITYDAWTGRELLRRNGAQGGVYSLAISRDNRLLASGGENTTSLVWEVPALPGPPRLKLSDESAWDDLGSLDARTGFRAMLHLSAQPESAARLIVEKVRPRLPVDPKRAAKLIEALDADSYTEREKAAAELEKMGHGAEEALKKAARSPSLEVKRRAEMLLAKLEGGSGTSPVRLRRERAVEVLERLGGAKARESLRKLLETKPDPTFAETIREALARLGEAG